MKVDIGISDDYACLTAGNIKFYYGYEVEVDGEWCFTVKVDGKEKLWLKYSDLDMGGDDEPVKCLLKGIGIYLSENK